MLNVQDHLDLLRQRDDETLVQIHNAVDVDLFGCNFISVDFTVWCEFLRVGECFLV